MKLNRKAMLGAACAAMFGLNAMSQSADPQQLQAAIQKKLSSSHFKGVTVQLNNGVATLGGTVELYEYKASADDRAHHVKGVTAVDNEIQVAGKRVDDAELRQQLDKKIAYDREGWPDQAFNDITVSVSNGVVTLGGNAAVPWAKDSAIAVARNTPGATDVVDDITVDPTSEFDNQTLVAVFRPSTDTRP